METLHADVIAEKNKLAGSTPWIWLCELHPTATERVYLCDDNQAVTYNSIEYKPFPFKVEDQDMDGSGNIPALSLTIPNTTNFVSLMLERSRGFTGRIIILTLINSGRQVRRQTFRTQGVTVTEQAAQFTIGFDDLYKIAFPSGRMIRNRCPFQYKGTLCGYAGALPTCDHTARSNNGCEAHENAPRIGAFLGIPRAA
jgi:phage-related protein